MTIRTEIHKPKYNQQNPNPMDRMLSIDDKKYRSKLKIFDSSRKN